MYLGNFYLHDPSRIQRRKEELAPDEWDVEGEWLDCIGWAVMAFLNSKNAEEAFRPYDAHIAKQKSKH